jgi:hypothetical protein
MKYHLFINKQGKLPRQAIIDMQRWFLNNAGKKITIILEKFRKERTNDQLAYWFAGIVNPFMNKFGYEKDMAHKMLKLWCGWYNVMTNPDGEEVKIIRSINRNEEGKKSSTTDLMGLIEIAKQKCAEHDLYIKDSEEYFNEHPKEY